VKRILTTTRKAYEKLLRTPPEGFDSLADPRQIHSTRGKSLIINDQIAQRTRKSSGNLRLFPFIASTNPEPIRGNPKLRAGSKISDTTFDDGNGIKRLISIKL
jgi:hypothetical protein